MKRFIEGEDRKQLTLLPECLDDFIDDDMRRTSNSHSHSRNSVVHINPKKVSLMRSSTVKTTLLALTSTFLLCATVPAIAQTSASAPDSVIAPASAGQPMTKAEQKKQAKAQRKAERKAAHAKNTAELKKLEASGYRPVRGDPNYPEDLQAAQKKANEATGASQ